MTKIRKARKFAENRDIAFSKSRDYNLCISISNLDTEKYVKNYASVAASNLFQAPKHS